MKTNSAVRNESARVRSGLFQLTGDPTHQLDTNGEDTLLGKAQRILDEKGESLTDDAPTVVINDLAGQRMYYILHQLLLTVALTQYVVAVSLEHELDTPLGDEEDQVFGMTHGENLDFWLSSIFDAAPPPTSCWLHQVGPGDQGDQGAAAGGTGDVPRGQGVPGPHRTQVCISNKTGEGVAEVQACSKNWPSLRRVGRHELPRYGAVPLAGSGSRLTRS